MTNETQLLQNSLVFSPTFQWSVYMVESWSVECKWKLFEEVQGTSCSLKSLPPCQFLMKMFSHVMSGRSGARYKHSIFHSSIKFRVWISSIECSNVNTAAQYNVGRSAIEDYKIVLFSINLDSLKKLHASVHYKFLLSLSTIFHSYGALTWCSCWYYVVIRIRIRRVFGVFYAELLEITIVRWRDCATAASLH